MKIKLLSDIHLEFKDYSIDGSSADVIVLAGDIHLGDKGVKWMQQRIIDVPVIYVLGNHEYYGKVYPKLIRNLKEQTQGSNITLLENESLQIENVVFFGCTLWSDFELFGNPRIHGYECQQQMTDYKRIRREPNYSKIRSMDVAAIHKRSTTWLANEYEKHKGDKNVVVTHHAPSIRSLPERRQKQLISAAYASNLEPLVKKLSPNLWLHGHIHRSSDYYIDQTRVVCNPKGYPDAENEHFKENLIITI